MPTLEHAQANKVRLESLSVLIKTAIDTRELDLLNKTTIIAEKIRISLNTIIENELESTSPLNTVRNKFDLHFKDIILLSKELIPQDINSDSNITKLREMGESHRSLKLDFEIIYTQSYRQFNEAILVADYNANRLLYLCAIAIIILLLTGMLTYVALSKYILSPIQSLVQSTDIVAAGDLHHVAPVTAEDELGRLTKSFNGMTRSLLNNYDELRDRNTQLELAAKSKNSFLANTSHEIRTPLTAIIGFSEELLNEDLTEHERTYSLNSIISSGIHLKNVINDILDISKIEADKLAIEKTSTDLHQLIIDVESIVIMRTNEKGLEFLLNYHFPLPTIINTDALRLKQILINLAGNATKFTSRGRIEINISFDKSKHQLKFSIVDSGIGIEPKDIDRIFEMFTQSDDSTTRIYGGTGLGLPLSKKLTHMLGGEMWVNSTPDVGSQFNFTIDVGQIDESQFALSEWPSNSENADSTNFSLASYKMAGMNMKNQTQNNKSIDSTVNSTLTGNILLAEDTQTNQKLIAFYLRNTAINLTIVNNGKQAVEKALSNQYDLILMDIQMPIMSGLEAISALKKNNYSGPIVAVTANVLTNDVANYAKRGFAGTIPKPLEKNAFLHSLSLFLESIPNSNEAEPLVSNDLDNAKNSPKYSSHHIKRGLKKFSTLLNQLQAVHDELVDLPSNDSTPNDITDSDPIYSSSKDTDPDFLELLSTYIENVESSSTLIKNSAQDKQWDVLRIEIHNIKGSAGAYGYQQLSYSAAEIYQDLSEENFDCLTPKIAKLTKICDRIVAGHIKTMPCPQNKTG